MSKEETYPAQTIYRSDARRLPRNGFTHANQFKLFENGSELYERMLNVIDSAEHEINLEVYIFREDNAGLPFVEHLIKASQREVTVRIIIDAWGSFSFSNNFLYKLERAGAEIVRYRPFSPFTGGWGWRRRDHRKLMTVDQKIGFIGGMNIGREYMAREDGGFGIRDTHLEVHGPVVKQINDVFSYNWQNHHQALDTLTEKMESDETACTCESDEACARISRGRWKAKNLIREEYLNQIQQADKYIKLTQSYFLPTEDILEALYRARERGCCVELIVPGVSDVPPLQYGTRYLYSDLLEHGIQVYEYTDSLLHSKTAVIDDSWATVGTFNFDYQSIFHNLEVNITVKGKQFARKMRERFETDIERSRKIDSQHLSEWNWWDWTCARFWHWFRWAL